MSQAVYVKLDSDASMLLNESDQYEGNSENHIIGNIAIKLDKLAQHLDLIKYNKKGRLKSARLATVQFGPGSAIFQQTWT